MKNVTIKEGKGKVTIEIDTTKNFGLSKSGKTVMIATTGGNKEIGRTGIYLGLNAYRYPTDEE